MVLARWSRARAVARVCWVPSREMSLPCSSEPSFSVVSPELLASRASSSSSCSSSNPLRHPFSMTTQARRGHESMPLFLLRARGLHLSPESSDHLTRSFVNSPQEEDYLQYEASKKLVKPLYRALLYAVIDLINEFFRFRSENLLSASEIAWFQDHAPGAVAAIRQGEVDYLDDFVKQLFRESLPSIETPNYTELKHELGSRLDCGLQALSMITKRVALLRNLTAEPDSNCTTDGIRVTVESLFQTSDSDLGTIFYYRIRIRNESHPEPVQLISRHWLITDFEGRTQAVIGPAVADQKKVYGEVVGQQPVLEPGQEYEYSSLTVLKTKRGSQKGTYSMLALESQKLFDVKIAPFALARPFGLDWF